MTSTSFGDVNNNSGSQIGVNHGSITQVLTPSAFFESDRVEILQQPKDIDIEVLESLAFQHMLDRKDNIEKWHTNTCEWILDLEEYKSWKSQSCGLLWIKGKPGAGKSTLMAFLYDKLDTSPDCIQLEFFFTARGTEMQHTPLGMLRSLLNQIFNHDPTVRPRIREAYSRRCRKFGYGKRMWEWPKSVLEELLASAIFASANQQHVMVFVDALDEAGTQSAQQLATYFHRLINQAEAKNLSLQICISCRHYPIMETGHASEINVEDHNQGDIATYIQDNLVSTEPEGHNDINPSQNTSIRRMLLKPLTQQANGLFQWIHIVLPLIEQRVRESESFDDISSWLREVPTDLEEVYTYILSHVIEERNRERSLIFFQWMCLAERPLTVTEIRYALVAPDAPPKLSPRRWKNIKGFFGTNEDMVQRIQAISGGLAELVPSDDIENATIQAVHQSVNDFLLRTGLNTLRQIIDVGALPLTEGHIHSQCQANLYRSCLVFLTSAQMSAETIKSKGYVEKLVQDHPFLDYAALNLFRHAEKAAGSRCDVLENEGEVLRDIYSFWVHIYRERDKSMPPSLPEDTTLLHMAASANLVDLIRSIPPSDGDIKKRIKSGDTAFHWAARRGHVTAGKILRGKGADKDAKNNEGMTPLTEASSGGHLDFVQWLLHKDTNLKIKDDGGALQAASFGGHDVVVEILLAAGADVNAQGGGHGTALQAAARCGRAETVQILLDAYANVNAQGGEYGNALQAAACSGSSETVQILLDAYANVNAQGGEYGNALQAAARWGKTEIVQILLSTHANVNAQGGKYGNALQAAAYSGSSETVQILLDAHANVNAQGGEYGNALQVATRWAHTETVQILLDAHANVNAQGGYYGNALQAAACSGSTKIVQILLDTHTNVNAQGGEYGNALQAAARYASTEIVQLLLDAQANVNAQGGTYGNALQAAACSGSTEIVQILLDAHANVNAQGGYYGNALQAAACSGSTEIVQLLLDTHANVNTQDSTYGNALQAAACSGSTKIVQILLDAHANVNAQGGEYGNALQAAACSGSTEIVQLLLDAHTNVNTQGGIYGNTLQAAARWAHTETVQILLDTHANVNAQGGYYGNALQAAACSGSTEIVQLLLDAQANVNAQGGKYGNALQAAACSGSAKIVQQLLDANADVNTQGGEYGNALQAALYGESIETLHILLDAQADVNAQSIRGRPLMIAVSRGDADEIRILLHAGADIHGASHDGWTSLHVAASRNMLRILSQFPQLALSSNHRDRMLQTPLHLAVYFGHYEFALALLTLGADPSLEDGYGRNIMDWEPQNENLMQEIRRGWPRLLLTPPQTQKLAVYRSISELSNSLSICPPESSWGILQQLGRYFLFLGKFDNARCLFQLHLSQDASFGLDFWKTSCTMCDKYIFGSRFVCKVCAHMDLCSFCVPICPFHSTLHPNEKHELFEVCNLSDKNFEFTGTTSEDLRIFLGKLIPALEDFGNDSDQSVIDVSHSSMLTSAGKLSLNYTFSLATITCAILCVLLAVLLAS